MSEIDWNTESRRFDAVAEQYDTYRPGYPNELINTIITSTGLQKGCHILEIGSGTGKATEAFTGKGYHILCIEPGANLAAVAAHKFRDFPGISFEQARFEDWESNGRRFDLVISAQAFHWVPEGVGYAKAAGVLKPGGCLALFWNMYPYSGSHIRRQLDKAYQHCAPEIAAKDTDIEANINRIKNTIGKSGYFRPPRISRFPWSRNLSTHEYLGLLNTYSDHLRLEADRRKRLLAEIAAVIDNNGGRIEHTYLAVLFTAQKAVE